MSNYWRIPAFLLWMVLLIVGTLYLWRFDNSPGDKNAVLQKWPQSSALKREIIRPTLVVFVHPKCACSRATIDALTYIVSRELNLVSVKIVFYLPPNVPASWGQTTLLEKAKAIPGVEIVTDRDGVEAHRFQVATSGQVYLFSKKGDLLFTGGITPSRGHTGDNQGRNAVLNIIKNKQGLVKSEVIKTFVFGCSLHSRKVDHEF